MTALTKNGESYYNTNLVANKTLIYISRKSNANQAGITWVSKHLTPWVKYQIKETDMRQKTASFTSNQYIDLTTGVYCVLITSPYHEDFSGIILKVEYDEETGLYEYQCQDWSRSYQSKFTLVSTNSTVQRLLKYMITRGGIPITGNITKTQEKTYKNMLSGLRPAYQYEQKYWGVDSKKNFNPMSEKRKMVVQDKSWIEAIRDLVYGSGAYIDVYFDKYGILHIAPYHKTDLFSTGLFLTSAKTSSRKFSFDTTNVITGTIVKSEDALKNGKYYSSTNLINLDLSAFFGDLRTTVANPNTSQASTGGTSTSNTSKKSTSTKNKNNPYGTKKKVVWLNSDNILGKSADKKFMNDIAKLLKKQGWKTKVGGVGPNFHTEKYMGPKDGVWFCIYGGADAAVFKETVGKNSYTNKLKKLNSRTVIGMRQGCDIRKGGKCYKYLKRAWDDNYSKSSFKGLSYPIDVLTKGKVPICYGSTPEKMVAKFLAGGDNPKAC